MRQNKAHASSVSESGSAGATKKRARENAHALPKAQAPADDAALGALSFDELMQTVAVKTGAASKATPSIRAHSKSVPVSKAAAAAIRSSTAPLSKSAAGSQVRSGLKSRSGVPDERKDSDSSGSRGESSDDDAEIPSLEEHRADLARLEAKDPAFFAFLKKNSSNLLDFGHDSGGDSDQSDDNGEDQQPGSGDEGDIDADDDGESDRRTDDEAEPGPKKRARGKHPSADDDEEEEDGEGESESGPELHRTARARAPSALTSAMLRDILRAALPPRRKNIAAASASDSALSATASSTSRPTGSYRALVRLAQAFRAAVYSGDDGGDVVRMLGLRNGRDGAGAVPARVAGNRQGRAGRSDERPRAHLPTAAQDDGGVDGGEDGDAAGGSRRRLHYAVSSGAVYMSVVVRTLQAAPRALAAHLGSRRGGSSAATAIEVDAKGPGPRVLLTEYSGWESRVAPVARSLLTSYMKLLGSSTDSGLLLFLLRAARPLLPYVAPFAALTRKLIKALLKLFGGDAPVVPPPPPPGTNEDDAAEQAADAVAAVRLSAYLRLRQVATALPYPAIDAVLRGLYLAYVRSAQYVNETTAPALMLAANCVTEAFGIDEAAAYTHAFGFLRQLALHLRAALTIGGSPDAGGRGAASAGASSGNKRKAGAAGKAAAGGNRNAMAVIGSWQYLNCLRLWTAVVSRYGAAPSRPLFQLAYPLAQLLQGTVRALPGPKHFPLRLHCAAALVELSWSTGLYVPIAPMLLDVLRCPALTRKPTAAAPSHGNAIVLPLMVRVGSSSLATRAVQDALVQRALELLLDATRAHYASPALPEVVAPTVAALRGFAKSTKVSAWRGRARALVDAFTAQSAVVASRRASLGVAPGDRVALASFMSAESQKLRSEREVARAAAAATAMAEARERAKVAATSRSKRGDGDEDEGESDDDESDGVDDGSSDEEEQEEDEESGEATSEGDNSDPDAYEQSGGTAKARAGAAKKKNSAEVPRAESGGIQDMFPEMEVADISDDEVDDGDDARNAVVARVAAAAAAARKAAKRQLKRKGGRPIPRDGAADEVADLDMADL